MYVRSIHFENAARNRDGRFTFRQHRGTIRKWTLLPARPASRELLQLTALACAGTAFLPRIPGRLGRFLRRTDAPLHIELVVANHAERAKEPPPHPLSGSGVEIDAQGSIRSLRSAECYLMPPDVPVRKPRQVADLDDLLQNRCKKLILLDDNLLAHPQAGEFLEDMARRKLQVNFNQTLDIRLLDKEKANLLRQIRCSNARFTRSAYHFSLNHTHNLNLVRRRYRLLGFGRNDNVQFICMYGYNTTLAEDVERFRFLRSLTGAYVFVQRYQPHIEGPEPNLSGFFDERADELIDELISILYPQNMKSMETYYRWVSKRYAQTFGRIHVNLVDTIFRYNNRHRKGRYIAELTTAFGAPRAGRTVGQSQRRVP